MSRESGDSRPELLRVLGLAFGVAVVVGGVVGQGILRGPGIVAAVVPNESLILILWLAGGALAAITAFAWVELAASLPQAGGPYVFVGRAFSPLAGTVTGWIDYFQGSVNIALFAVVFAEYVHRLGILSSAPEAGLAVSLIAVVTAINWTGTRTSGLAQEILSAAKGVGLLLLVVLMFTGPEAPNDPVTESAPALTVAAFAIALRTIYNTYGGWNAAAYFTEEMHEPDRNLARSMFGGIALVTLLYVLFTAAMLHALTPEQMAASKLPVADAVSVAIGPAADVFVNVVALVSVAAIAHLYAMYVSRVGFAMARSRVLPRFMTQVSSAGTPRAALVITTSVAAVLAAFGSYEQLIAITVAFGFCVDLAVNAGSIALRMREPDLARPFRMPLFPLPAIFSLILNGLLLAAVVYEDPINSLLGLVVVTTIALSTAGLQSIRRFTAR